MSKRKCAKLYTWDPNEAITIEKAPLSYEKAKKWLETLLKGGAIDEEEFKRKLKEYENNK